MISIYTDKIKTAGLQAGPVILIRPECRNDDGLHDHEKTHVTQWLRVTGAAFLFFSILYLATENAWSLALSPLSIAVHGLAYKLLPTYRLHCELEAYREQSKHYQDDRMLLFARCIANDYGLRIS